MNRHFSADSRGPFDRGLGTGTIGILGLVVLIGRPKEVKELVPLADSPGGDRLVVVVVPSVGITWRGRFRWWTGRGRARVLGHGGCAKVGIVAPITTECVIVRSPLTCTSSQLIV
ncbi:hypothetical protein K457DRAFT_1160665 [Linnemannia elongata AG-77]|uniref:Uncharacterized protein n=1 Tax=Linnemannia elongata AG-77 TaxID=1314771 RepID=A0A197JBP8_9FUNG|nr:hypothetical protein K457DRAFT_1160665 [Linnemannia elongata AG-77]